MKRDSRTVYSTTDGDLRKARDPGLKERRSDGNRVKVRREVAGRRGKAVTAVDVVIEILEGEGYTPVLAGG
jgi:translation initiation factor 1